MVVFRTVAERIGLIEPLIKCSNASCGAITSHPFDEDIRKRWIVNQMIGDDIENAHVNLCPSCVRMFFNLTEEDYKQYEEVEKSISEMKN